jgi:emp24/gp25L/p24 family/GOLD
MPRLSQCIIVIRYNGTFKSNISDPSTIYNVGDMIGDFLVTDLMTFEIRPQSTEVLKETIVRSSNNKSISMQMMFVAMTNTNSIYFSIKPADNWSKVIYTSEYSNMGQYKDDNIEPGQYGFIFYNQNSREPIKIMFALHIENAKENLANATKKSVVEPLGDEVNPLHQRLLGLGKLISKYTTNQQILSAHNDMQYTCIMVS